jgi:hypothetical protein
MPSILLYALVETAEVNFEPDVTDKMNAFLMMLSHPGGLGHQTAHLISDCDVEKHMGDTFNEMELARRRGIM